MRWAEVVAVAVVVVDEVQASEHVASVSTMTMNVFADQVLLAVEAVVIVSFCSATGGMCGAWTSCPPSGAQPSDLHSVMYSEATQTLLGGHGA